MFELEFKSALAATGLHENLIDSNWKEVRKAYQSSSRHYHNLSHLDQLVAELQSVKDEIQDWTTLIFSVAYHDFVYKILRKDNEEKSGERAVKKLLEFKYDFIKMNKCKSQILATKSHGVSNDSDTNYFTDADLSILGVPSNRYALYTLQIRKEYRYYPDLLYNPGRVKVLRHFLDMAAIFKTQHFTKRYEEQARINIEWEIGQLQS